MKKRIILGVAICLGLVLLLTACDPPAESDESVEIIESAEIEVMDGCTTTEADFMTTTICLFEDEVAIKTIAVPEEEYDMLDWMLLHQKDFGTDLIVELRARHIALAEDKDLVYGKIEMLVAGDIVMEDTFGEKPVWFED